MKPRHTVIVSPQIPVAYKNGGIGTFVGHLIDLLLSGTNDRITLIFTEPPQQPESEWLPAYHANNVTVHCVHPPNLTFSPGYFQTVRISELVCSAMPEDADIVYFADWRANALHTVRSRRFTRRPGPTVVTVLHGCSEWNRHGQGLYLTSYEELAEEYFERYAVENSNFLVFPSRHMAQWCSDNGWRVPPIDEANILGYPFRPESTSSLSPSKRSNRFSRLIFYGRLETRKGFDVFIEALLRLKLNSCLEGLTGITFLGMEGVHHQITIDAAAAKIQNHLALPTTLITDLDAKDANRYLERHRGDSLVLTPSLLDNLPFTVIEASLIPGLNLLASSAAGIPEILGERGTAQLFSPDVGSTAQAIEAWLSKGPQPSNSLSTYDWKTANERWLQFHTSLPKCCDTTVATAVTTSNPPPSATPQATVDVCIPYFNAGRYLPDLLESLANQRADFNVFLVDDGSTDPHSKTTFERMRAKYRSSDWHFLSTPNRGPCAARNYAASLGEAPYLCFVDADNVAAPNMLPSFLQSITCSGDDCLTCYLYCFQGDDSPYWPPSGSANPVLRACDRVYLPLGNSLEAGILSNAFGDVNMIIRREVFEAVQGFSTDYDRHAGNEDYEFLLRLSLKGYRLDVVPEFLVYYRDHTNSRTKTMSYYASEMRVLRHYETLLRASGLSRLAPLITGLKHKCYVLQQQMHSQQTCEPRPSNELYSVEQLVEYAHWSRLVLAFPLKLKRLYRVWRKGSDKSMTAARTRSIL